LRAVVRLGWEREDTAAGWKGFIERLNRRLERRGWGVMVSQGKKG
jgi:hypothetical protein